MDLKNGELFNWEEAIKKTRLNIKSLEICTTISPDGGQIYTTSSYDGKQIYTTISYDGGQIYTTSSYDGRLIKMLYFFPGRNTSRYRFQ